MLVFHAYMTHTSSSDNKNRRVHENGENRELWVVSGVLLRGRCSPCPRLLSVFAKMILEDANNFSEEMLNTTEADSFIWIFPLENATV